jgi:hypothetical protein
MKEVLGALMLFGISLPVVAERDAWVTVDNLRKV